jgi:hypothetical protein
MFSPPPQTVRAILRGARAKRRDRYTGDMTVTTRFIAAIVLLIMTGVPVAGLVCARECGLVADAASTASESHCHEPGSGASTSVRPLVTEGCVVLALGEPAMRERAATPLRASLALAPQVAFSAPRLRSFRHAERRALHDRGGLSPGASVPLRI